MAKKEKGGGADLKAQRAAAVLAVDFQTNSATKLLRAMAVAADEGSTAKASKEEASILFCQFAADMVRTELDRDGGANDRAVITEGFCKHLDTLRPMLAAEGSPLVDVKTEDGKDTRYSWKGHGANVKSIAKGVTEFVDVEGEVELIDVFNADSFSDIKRSVQVCRQADEDEAARELREAKEAYREVEATIRKMVLGRKTADEVIELTTELVAAIEVLRLIIETAPAVASDDASEDADTIAEAA